MNKGSAPIEATTATRMTEERKAASMACYTVRFLQFGEPFARTDSAIAKLEDVCDAERDPESEPIYESVHTALCEILDSHTGPILCPMAYGDHVDHRIVARSIRDLLLLNGKGLPVGFYEDQPYAAYRSGRKIAQRVDALTLGHRYHAVPIVGGDIHEKLTLLAVYESQIEDAYLKDVREHWRLCGAEYLWLPESMELESFLTGGKQR